MANDSFVLTSIKKVLHIPERIPPYIQIAITNLCNKDCGMCIRFQVPIEKRHMEFDDFKRVVNSVKGAKAITLVGLGEPLMHPDIIKAIKYCKKNGFKTRLTSNGILLNEKANELVDAGLDSIHLSVEDVREKEFLDAILKLKRIRDKKNTNCPEIVLQPILFNDNEEGGRSVQDVYDILSWCGENGIDKVNIARVDKRTDSNMKRPDVKEEKGIFKEFDRLRKKYGLRIDCLQDQVYQGFKGTLYRYSKHLLRLDSYCYRFQDYLYIDVNGNAHPCPINMDQIMGNIHEQSLYDIWNGKKYNYLRKHQERFEFCRKCDFLKLKQVA